MDALETYICFVAMKNHFSKPDYDFIKYSGKIKTTSAAFEKRKDRFLFQKLSKQKDVKNFLVANFVKKGAKIWINELVNDQESDRIYIEWKRKQESLTKMYSDELELLLEQFDANFTTKSVNHPHLFKLCMSNRISIETVMILNSMLGFFSSWSKHMKDDPLWEEFKFRCIKYEPFFHFDVKRMKTITLEKFSQEVHNG
jgi:hypothetical protein